jgi:hypothetical protein
MADVHGDLARGANSSTHQRPSPMVIQWRREPRSVAQIGDFRVTEASSSRRSHAKIRSFVVSTVYL